MEFGLDKLFCWQTAVFSFTIWMITFGVRRLVERAFPQLTDKTRRSYGWWGDTIVPALPVVVGVAMSGFITETFPYPEGMQLLWGRLMFGAFCGLISSKVYQLVWGALKSKIPDPPADPPAVP